VKNAAIVMIEKPFLILPLVDSMSHTVSSSTGNNVDGSERVSQILLCVAGLAGFLSHVVGSQDNI